MLTLCSKKSTLINYCNCRIYLTKVESLNKKTRSLVVQDGGADGSKFFSRSRGFRILFIFLSKLVFVSLFFSILDTFNIVFIVIITFFFFFVDLFIVFFIFIFSSLIVIVIVGSSNILCDLLVLLLVSS